MLVVLGLSTGGRLAGIFTTKNTLKLFVYKGLEVVIELDERLPPFLTKNNLKPFIFKELRWSTSSALAWAMGIDMPERVDGDEQAGSFTTQKALKPYVNKELAARAKNPIKFRLSRGGPPAFGFWAEPPSR